MGCNGAMKIWSALFFIAFMSEGKADLIEVVEEEPDSSVILPRLEEPQEETKGKDTPSSEEKGIHQQDEKPKSDLISSSRNETAASPGAGRRDLNPRYLKVNITFPTIEAPWWERWWLIVKGWFQ